MREFLYDWRIEGTIEGRSVTARYICELRGQAISKAREDGINFRGITNLGLSFTQEQGRVGEILFLREE